MWWYHAAVGGIGDTEGGGGCERGLRTGGGRRRLFPTGTYDGSIKLHTTANEIVDETL